MKMNRTEALVSYLKDRRKNKRTNKKQILDISGRNQVNQGHSGLLERYWDTIYMAQGLPVETNLFLP